MSKATWISKYSPKKYITVNQYILEIVCEAYAKKQGKDLPLQFWKLDEWKKEYLSQTRAVSRLLKKYSAKAILQAIRGRNIWSLRPKWVENIIAQEEKKIQAAEKVAQLNATPKEERVEIQAVERPRRSKLDSLMELDNI